MNVSPDVQTADLTKADDHECEAAPDGRARPGGGHPGRGNPALRNAFALSSALWAIIALLVWALA